MANTSFAALFESPLPKTPAAADEFNEDMGDLVAQAVDERGIIEHVIGNYNWEDDRDFTDAVGNIIDEAWDDLVGGSDFRQTVKDVIGDIDFTEDVNFDQIVGEVLEESDVVDDAAEAAVHKLLPKTFFGRLRWLFTGQL